MRLEKYFAPRQTVEQVEEGLKLAPKFDKDGLIPVVTTDYHDNTVLMHGYMNAAALLKTLETQEAHYWSRSRKVLWHKGATSGFIQKIKQVLIDDDQDAIWLRVEVVGKASCHVGYRSCFYREITTPVKTPIDLKKTEKEKVFSPDKVYKDCPNPTQL